MSVINTNYLALVSQNNLTKSQSALGTAIERLSSGLRINSAKDDAAGQAIANRFTANIKGLTQAARNANDGISIAQTTEGSLNEINNNLQRIRELSVQAANGSNSQTDLDSIQAEIKERLDEIDRVSRETQFNGKYVLGEDAASLSVQVGAHDNQRINIELTRIDSSTLNLGTYNINGTSAGSLTPIDTSKGGPFEQTIPGGAVKVEVQENSFTGATTPPTGSGVTAVVNGSGDIDVYEVTGKANTYAIEASDNNFYTVKENTSTGQWFWDSSDVTTLVNKADLSTNPVSYTASNSNVNTNNAAAGFSDQSNVTLTGLNSAISGDLSGIDTSALGSSATVESISYDSANDAYYAKISGADDTANDGYYEISVDSATGVASGALATGTAEALPEDSTQLSTTAINKAAIDTTGLGTDGVGTLGDIYYDGTSYYVEVTATTGGTNDGFYAITVDSSGNATGTLGEITDVGNSGTQPVGSNVVTHTEAAAGTADVTIDFSKGLFARNDINNAATSNQNGDTLTQKYAAQDTDGNFYEVTATFTLDDPASQGSKNIADYTVEYSINVSAGGAVQLSAQNVGPAIDGTDGNQLTLAQDGVLQPNEKDLYNLEYTIESQGLYEVLDSDGKVAGYAVKGSDDRYYQADVAVDSDGNFTGEVNWTTDDTDANYGLINAANIGDAVPDLINEDTFTTEYGQYTGLDPDQTLVSYQDSKGDTQYLIQTGTGDAATYVRATVAEADLTTGEIAVTVQEDDKGNPIAVTLRSDNPLAALDSALQQVDNLRSHLGAIQNRFESTISNLNNTVNNLSAARSRIEDTDYAVEVSNMTRAQILQQAGTSVLAQANQVPQTVLSLLR